MDPELLIILAVLASVALIAGAAVARYRRSARVMAAMREARRVEIPVQSQLRVAVATVLVLVVAAGVPVSLGLALDETRSHALAFMLGVIALATIGLAAMIWTVDRWGRVGTLVLDEDSAEVRLVRSGATLAIPLDASLELRDGRLVFGQGEEMLVAVTGSNGTSIVFRYLLAMGDEPLVPHEATHGPRGVLLGREARVIHERLRAHAS